MVTKDPCGNLSHIEIIEPANHIKPIMRLEFHIEPKRYQYNITSIVVSSLAL